MLKVCWLMKTRRNGVDGVEEPLTHVSVNLDLFSVSMHIPNARHWTAIRAVQGTFNGLWKMVQIPTGHLLTRS